LPSAGGTVPAASSMSPGGVPLEVGQSIRTHVPIHRPRRDHVAQWLELADFHAHGRMACVSHRACSCESLHTDQPSYYGGWDRRIGPMLLLRCGCGHGVVRRVERVSETSTLFVFDRPGGSSPALGRGAGAFVRRCRPPAGLFAIRAGNIACSAGALMVSCSLIWIRSAATVSWPGLMVPCGSGRWGRRGRR
jgi:hypothetical protein